MSTLHCNPRELTVHNKPLEIICFPYVPSYSCLWNIQSMSFCSSQQRKIQHVCMDAMEVQKWVQGQVQAKFCFQFYLMARKKGSNSSDNCGERKWNRNMVGEVRSPNTCSAVEGGCVYFCVCTYINICLYVFMLLESKRRQKSEEENSYCLFGIFKMSVSECIIHQGCL